ncbi:MAG TPA: M56 family metallopeptidase [Planctomycetaceae bacterium]|jgi:beta-lactamase regulating signal transducer with metallopeptidase domain|nr:M56 family metallopeptidase [Planctomycetaceae bacterium]
MNVSGDALLWCPVQVTVLALAALGIEAIIGRRRPAAGALVAASALVAVVGLTATALSPWPDWGMTWNRLPWRHATASTVSFADGSVLDAATKFPTLRVGHESRSDGSQLKQSTIAAPQTDSLLARSWTAIADNWAVVAVALYLVGIVGMAVRIVLGLTAVRGYRRNSRPVADRGLVELAEDVRVQLGCRRDVELRESATLSTPATIGWRRPILLLPADWPSWTDEERRAVLAHEIEHVRRSDFCSWMVAQIGIALHFYHPLVHSLAGRLRLEQELAADAAAARVVGGQRKYLATLAGMALRQSDAVVAWPAHAFLPTSKTFLRRIEMLHRFKSLRSDVSRPLFCLSVAAVALAAVCAAGIRGSSAGDDRGAAGSSSVFPRGSEDNSNTQFAILALREAAVAAEKPTDSPEKSGRTRNHLGQLALAMHNYLSDHKHFPTAAIMGPDGKTPHSWRVELLPYLEEKKLRDQYRMNEPWDSPANKEIVEKMPDVFRSPFDDPKSTDSGYYVLVGPGTLFEGLQGIELKDVKDGTSNTLLIVESKHNVPWTKPEDIPFDPDKPLPKLGGFVEGRFWAAIGDGSVRLIESEKAKDQLKWLIMRNDGHPIQWEKTGVPGAPLPAGRRRSFGADNKAVHDMNNLKKLDLAMLNYHDVHGHFPPAVTMGPDGKTPHSWRVELLPLLDQQTLYEQYQQNEPWDSPANKQVLAQIPDVFRSPYDDLKSTNSGYFALVGTGTVFEGTKGIKIAEITDGTSNTLMFVAAKRNIPWTKPEDIAFDPDQPLPALGGFVEGQFRAAMCDGSVQLFVTNEVKDRLKRLIMRNDGHPVLR